MKKFLIWMFLTIIVGPFIDILFGVGPGAALIPMFGFGGLWLIIERNSIGNVVMAFVIPALYFHSWITGTVMLLLWVGAVFARDCLALILTRRRNKKNRSNFPQGQGNAMGKIVEMDRHIKRIKIKLVLAFLGLSICGGVSTYFLQEIPFALLRTIVGLLLGAIPTIFIYNLILDLKLYKQMKRDWVDMYEAQKEGLENI